MHKLNDQDCELILGVRHLHTAEHFQSQQDSNSKHKTKYWRGFRKQFTALVVNWSDT